MIDLPPFPTAGPDRDSQQAEMRDILAAELYGPVPPWPDHLSITRTPLPGVAAERVEITLTCGPRRFTVDAALWQPTGHAPAPLICGLDFIGPLGVIPEHVFPLDPNARIYSRPEYCAPEGKLSETLRGTSAYRWPVGMLTRAGFAVMVSCYGAWVPDTPEGWRDHGLMPLMGQPKTGAISLWAWALLRMAEAAGQIDGIDAGRIAVAGHSRLGKAALWAGANDTRISTVFANNSGCAGAALSRHPVGETLAQMTTAFPHWLAHANPDIARFDQHVLLACLAPRPLYLASAAQDLWADPEGTQRALDAARAFAPDWPCAHHIRPGGHDLLPYDWTRFLDFTARFPV